jgi:predicted membrane protein
VALIQLTALWLWRHASKNELINTALDSRVVESIGRRLSLSTIIFVLSIPLALWNTWVVYLLWIGLFILLFTTDWLSWQQAGRMQQDTFPLEDTRRAHVQVQHGAGHLLIDSKTDEKTLLGGTFGGGLESRVSRSAEQTDIQLKALERQGFLSLRYPWSWGPANVLDWRVGLSNQIPIALDIETAGGQAVLELGALQITALTIMTSASSMTISLPDHTGQTVVTLEASTASIVILVPPEVAAHIQAGRSLSTIEVDLARFPMIEKGREYRSENFETAEKRVEIHLDVAIGSVKIY